jgi:hypothetical protein
MNPTEVVIHEIERQGWAWNNGKMPPVVMNQSGKRREVNARLSFPTACELGFRGSLGEWERLMGAVGRR